MTLLARNLGFAAVALIALGTGYFAAQWLRTPAAPISDAAGRLLEFSVSDVDGKIRSLGEWKGKVLVLNFWATWCPPCREEIPLLVAAQRRYGAQGVQVIGLAIDQPKEVAAYRTAVGINYPLLVDDAQGIKLMELYGNRSGSLPFTVVLDSQGAVVSRKIGALHGDELDRLLTPLLSPQMN
jgi:thiol-disulfide isomerase/thioredoxin